MLTVSDKEAFHAMGIVYLRSFLPKDKIRTAREQVLEGKTGGRATKSGAACSAALAALTTTELLAAVSFLADNAPVFPMTIPQALYTPPNATEWTLPHRLWHLDIPRFPEGGLSGIQMFSFLERVVPGGGGTLVVAGSHRLLNEGRRIHSSEVKRLLKREPYFEELMSDRGGERGHFLTEAVRVGEVAVQVVELHGEPGDVYLTDMRLLHAVAPNASPVPRLMVTQRFIREAFRKDISE